MFLRARQTNSEASGVVLLLIDENRKPAILSLVVFDLDLEILGLLCKLLGKGLEFEELRTVSES